MQNINEKTYDSVLQETKEYFKAMGVNILGEGYKEIATNSSLLEEYITNLTEGCNANDQEVMASLMNNTNNDILRESSSVGITPVASLSMPVIRKLWPKFTLRNSIATEVAKVPAFIIPYMKPYMYKGSEKVYLPKGAVDSDGVGNSAAASLTNATYTGTLTLGAPTTITFTDSASKAVELTRDFVVNTVKATIASKEYTYRVYKKLETVTGSLICDLTGGVASDKTTTTVTGQLVVRMDLAAGKGMFLVAGLTGGSAISVDVTAPISEEFNDNGWSVGFDIDRINVDIPVGQHLTAPLTIETLNDSMAMYNIDGTKTVIDIMTNFFASKLDQDVLTFLMTSYTNQPLDAVNFDGQYNGAAAHAYTFNVKPAAGFANGPRAWRDELKPLIDRAATDIMRNTYFQSGIFTLVGNPADVDLVQNIEWSFKGGQGGMDGVNVNYSIGTYVGVHQYQVISSLSVPQGKMLLVFRPSEEMQMTYKYYPYTFSTEKGYRDPNHANVPAIMMTKRHQFAEFLPAIALITISNNDATGNYGMGASWEDVEITTKTAQS